MADSQAPHLRRILGSWSQIMRLMPICLLLFCAQTFARQSQPKPSAAKNIDQLIANSLSYIASQQFQLEGPLYARGEWPTQMNAILFPAVVGVAKFFGGKLEEPTAFTTSSMINVLAEIYQFSPKHQQIPQLIETAIESLAKYRDGDSYSYYNWLLFKGVMIHAPKSAGYISKPFSGYTNVPADADTTSVTYTALLQRAKIQNKSQDFAVLPGALTNFSRFRDLARKPHYYNAFDGYKNTGAFLTWFIDENSPSMPKGLFDQPEKGHRIPFGTNDIDCVVNANVLRLLTLTQKQQSPGYEETCAFLNDVILRSKQNTCGIYYPNSYIPLYAISSAYTDGAQCLEPAKKPSLSFILLEQDVDGSWQNEPGSGRKDRVQSTALALNTIMNYAKTDSIQYEKSIRDGVKFLLTKIKYDTKQLPYWKGEVFFSAVAQARNTVLWRSDSYTTALAILAIVKAEYYLRAKP